MSTSLYIFDVDKTLSRSKEPVLPAMADALSSLLKTKRVAIISGGPLRELNQNVVTALPTDTNLANLAILPTSGGALYVWKDAEWRAVYAEKIDQEEAQHVEQEIRTACTETGIVDLTSASYGDRIEYRGPQVTLSALGQRAPIEEKEAWDPDGTKKRRLRDAIAERLPEYDVKTGGSTSIDITKHGINKAYGVRKLSEYLDIPISDMLYIGDALYSNGNDEVVKETGVATHQVTGPEETLEVIASVLT